MVKKRKQLLQRISNAMYRTEKPAGVRLKKKIIFNSKTQQMCSTRKEKDLLTDWLEIDNLPLTEIMSDGHCTVHHS